jgi:DUF4097 and DUF4098 domain-containing protein YvlB
MSGLLFVRQVIFDILSHFHTIGNSYSRKRTIQKIPYILLFLLLLLLSLSGCNTDQIHHTTTRSVLPSHTFTVTAPPSLTIHNDSGSVTLHTGKDNAVVVTATQHVTEINALSTPTAQPTTDIEDMQVNYDQQGNTIRVDAMNISNAALRAISLDFDVIVPARSDVQVYAGFGSINADGLHGRMALECQDGDITVNNISGPMTINGANGSVSANNMRGTLSLTLNNGDVEIQHASLTGASQITTERGSISFDGSIKPYGSYRFRTETGTIDLTLPTDSSFELDAITERGSVKNEFGSVHVGNEPRALLRVSSGLGSISLHSR